MADKKTVPTRGIKQDWYGDKEQERLENNKEYARKSIKNNLLGSPDFEMFDSFLISPTEQIDTKTQKTAEKQKKGEEHFNSEEKVN